MLVVACTVNPYFCTNFKKINVKTLNRKFFSYLKKKKSNWVAVFVEHCCLKRRKWDISSNWRLFQWNLALLHYISCTEKKKTVCCGICMAVWKPRQHYSGSPWIMKFTLQVQTWASTVTLVLIVAGSLFLNDLESFTWFLPYILDFLLKKQTFFLIKIHLKIVINQWIPNTFGFILLK